MSHKDLIIFDVDGTLVDSLDAEAICFPRACELALGIESVSGDWDRYAYPSDSGIVTELIDLHFGRTATSEDCQLVERFFLSLLKEAYTQHPDLCRPVPGARVAFQHAQELPNTVVSIATSGWSATALLKLSIAGFDASEIPLASSNDALAKMDIMHASVARARSRAGVAGFSSVVCIGDAAGDARAADALGFEFVGIDTYGFVHDCPHTFPDFTDRAAVFETVRLLQGNAQTS